MWRAMVVVVVVVIVSGCPRPKPAGPIEYVGGTDPHPGVPVDEPATKADLPPSAPTAPPTILPQQAPTQPTLAFEGDVPLLWVDHWYWCFAAKAGMDLCGGTKELCEQWMAKLGVGTGCVPAPQGVCFHTSSDGRKPDFGYCFRTTAGCKSMAELVAADKTADPISMGCTIFRAKRAPAPAIAPKAKKPLETDPLSGVPVVTVDHRMWCFTTKQSLDMCTSTHEQCTQWSAELGGGCVPGSEMTCFHTRAAGAEKDFGWCFRTVPDCKLMLDAVTSRPAHDPVTYGCMTLREGAN